MKNSTKIAAVPLSSRQNSTKLAAVPLSSRQNSTKIAAVPLSSRQNSTKIAAVPLSSRQNSMKIAAVPLSSRQNSTTNQAPTKIKNKQSAISQWTRFLALEKTIYYENHQEFRLLRSYYNKRPMSFWILAQLQRLIRKHSDISLNLHVKTKQGQISDRFVKKDSASTL